MNTLIYNAEKQGNDIVLKCNDGRIINSDKWEEIASFLLEPTFNNMAFVWNVDIFVENIIKYLPTNVYKSIKDGGKIITPDSRKLYYRIGRKFGINQIDIYSLSRYSDEVISNIEELSKLAKNVIKAFREFGLTPDKYTSPVAAYEPILNKIDFPRACDLPESAFSMINKCDERKWIEWRELYKVGHWQKEDITDYDISCAYPSLIARLPDLSGAKFFESDTMPEDKDYSWGELDGLLHITSDVTPFKIGEYEDNITNEQKWLIDKYEFGSFKMKHGWFFKLPSSYNLPFKDTMLNLYDKRCSANQMVSRIAKHISVGIGGKLAQRFEDDGGLGDNFNPIYARLITSRCEIKVADFVWRNGLQNDVVSILVDGCLVQGKHQVKVDNNGMGSWRINPKSPFLVASLLYQWGNEKKPNGKTYDEIMALIKANPNTSVYGDIDLNLLSHSRTFREQPRTGKKLLEKIYDSEPISK